jgi:hypothetical protein
MMRKFLLAAMTLLSAATLAGCDSAKKELGLTRSTPDEFAVVKRAPLEMPPEFTLRPPQPGAPRPQEQATADQARTALLGTNAVQADGLTKGEAALLNNAETYYDPNIRSIVDYEAANTRRENEPVVKKLMNIGGDQLPPATVVDPDAEAERLKKNAEEGRPVTEGETPVIED